MGKKQNIGVFGAYRGMTMINVLLGHEDARLVAVCDKYAPALEKAGERAKKSGVEIALYSDFDDFLKHDGLDAVVLANYANEHAPFAVKCLKAGKHVISEVLPCETMAEAVELIEAVEETGLVYAYAENYCYMEHTFEMWQRYEHGQIGEVMYAEGEYVHDCSSRWPSLTYGDKNHWRNIMHANYYCTHSLGPIITITGKRPIRVVGYETPLLMRARELGFQSGAGIEMVTLENGAVAKSLHGWLKREPSSINYQVYGQKGMMETGRLPGTEPLNIYTEGENLCEGDWERLSPEKSIAKEKAKSFSSHGGSDFYATHFFIEKILGRPDGRWSIDVYTAVDMGICGILAYRSVLNGNEPIDVPNLRDASQRDKYRNDHACTNPAKAGDQLLPMNSYCVEQIPDEVYERMRLLWEKGENAK